MTQAFPIYDICTLSGFKQDDILISRFAPYLAVHKNLHLAHRHSFYHLVFFTAGAGQHTIDFETFNVKPGHIYFMIPGQVHSWAFTGNVDGYVINFSAEFFNTMLLNPAYPEQFAFFDGNAVNGVIDIPNALQAGFINNFELIITEAETEKLKTADMVRALLIQLFINAARVQQHGLRVADTTYNHTLLRNFQKLVEQNYLKLRLPKEYAALLYITPNHLNALSKDILGMPAGEVIRNRVVLEAKRLLINPQLTITQIAYQLNFADNSYFSKFFKNYTGQNPEEFRRSFLTTKP